MSVTEPVQGPLASRRSRSAVIGALVVALLCVAVLRRRGTWTVFTRATAALGWTLAVGGSLAQWLTKQASDTASAAVVRKNNRAKAIRFSTLDAICRVLDCSIGELLSLGPSVEQ